MISAPQGHKENDSTKTKSSLKLQCIQTHDTLTKALKEKYTAAPS